MDPRSWIILLVALVGNCGFWLFWFNRINATGLPRRATKSFEKLFVLVCFAIPTIILILEWNEITTWLFQSGGWWPQAFLFRAYGAWCVGSFFVLGAIWLESRRWGAPPKLLISQSEEHVHVDKLIQGGSHADRKTKFLNSLPGNQIGQLSVTRKELKLPRTISGVDGLTIGHISDLHFTGQYREEHYRFVLDRFQELEPDLMIISGDIIDYDRYLPWIDRLFAPLHAQYGVSFVLGNHDRRLIDVEALSNRISKLGFFDLGKCDQELQLESGTTVQLTGNELPWLKRNVNSTERLASKPSTRDQNTQLLRIGVSHSPDQIGWARRQACDLMFAGHTHGGQVRLPIIGPLVTPSLYGGRFACGVFHLEPTLMHVSRGIAGTHPLRWWCLPEISLLTLRS